jgi:Na(+)/H(+) antiporter
VSLFVKEKLFIGEATVATIAGLILGPHCLGWFDPVTWGNTDFITLEICRIVLCIQIVAVAVELPRKYMKKHWVSVAIFLLPVMTIGWLVVGLFVWILIPNFNFSDALLVSACVTATDPILAAAVVGKGKFAERVPGHLRNLLSAESGCNDGMAFPFIFLALNLVLYPGDGGTIVKNWFTLTILWECFFGCLLGTVLGYILRKAVAFAESKNLIDRESFLAVFIFLAFNCAGIGSMLGVDDLLVSFAAGTSFGWNGDFARKTEESHVSTVIDLLLNLAFFVYFGAIVPWPEFNNAAIGLNVWRLVVLAFVIIFLRRIPAVVALKPFTPDIKSWREALFCGHFGPIGVGAIFASILARKDLEAHYTTEETPLAVLPAEDSPHYQLLASIWPITCFVVIVSIIVHGSSVAVLTLGRRLNRMAITMSFTTTNTQDQGPSWMARLQKLDKASSSFSLHRVDTVAPSDKAEKLQHLNTVETSGIKVRPAGGAQRRKKQKKRKAGPGDRLKKSLSRGNNDEDEKDYNPERQRPQAEFLQLGKTSSRPQGSIAPSQDSPVSNKESYDETSSHSLTVKDNSDGKLEISIPTPEEEQCLEEEQDGRYNTHQLLQAERRHESIPTTAFQEGSKIIIEDQNGEIVETVPVKDFNSAGLRRSKSPPPPGSNEDIMSIHSEGSLYRNLSQYSSISGESSIHSDDTSAGNSTRLSKIVSRTMSKKIAYKKKNSNTGRKVYAHQIDDLLVIENEDGEIIRRYKVNRHIGKGKPAQRARSGSIVDRALSFVGMKSHSAKTTEAPPPEDLEKGDSNNLLVMEHDSKDPKSPLNDAKIAGKIENKLNDILHQKNTLHRPSVVPEELAEEDTDDSEDSEDLDDSDLSQDSEDGEILQETEVERRRRIAALGRSKRDQSDEEE